MNATLAHESLVDIHVFHLLRWMNRQLDMASNTVRSYLRDIAKSPNYGPCATGQSKLDALFDPLNVKIKRDFIDTVDIFIRGP